VTLHTSGNHIATATANLQLRPKATLKAARTQPRRQDACHQQRRKIVKEDAAGNHYHRGQHPPPPPLSPDPATTGT